METGAQAARALFQIIHDSNETGRSRYIIDAISFSDVTFVSNCLFLRDFVIHRSEA